MSHTRPGGSKSARPVLFLSVLFALVVACNGSSTGPTPPPPPPPANNPPVVSSIVVRGTVPRQPAQYASLGETVNVTATVTDAETPVSQLTYEWSSSVGGTFSGNGADVTWTAPTTVGTPVNAILTLTVIERFGSNQMNRVTATSTVDLHNSPREVGDLAVQFLEDFSRQLSVDVIMRNFTTSCPEAAEERAQVTSNNNLFETLAWTVDRQRMTVTVPFAGTCPFRNVRGDACAQVPVSWTSRRRSNGVVGTNSGTDHVTAVLEAGAWKLCASDYECPLCLSLPGGLRDTTGFVELMTRPYSFR